MKKSSTFLLSILACLNAICLPATKNRFDFNPGAGQEVRSNLYYVKPDAGTILLDGDLTQYDASYSNTIDGLDARKMSNFSENIGMLRGATTLVIERRHTITSTDTIFYKLWNTHQATTYQLEFVADNMDQPGLTGYLEDKYLHTSVALNLNGSNNINFSINADAASAAVDRFRIIFSTVAAAALPLTFTSIKGFEENNMIDINWKTANEQNLQTYNIERSSDGTSFSEVSGVAANNLPASTYSWVDAHPVSGANYYRIKSQGIGGSVMYSDVLKIISVKALSSMQVFPNPVINNTINLRLENQPCGIYVIKLVNNSGQIVFAQQLNYNNGTSTEVIKPTQKVPKGIYFLEVTKPGGSKTDIQLLY